MISGLISGLALSFPGRKHIPIGLALIMFILSLVLLFAWFAKMYYEWSMDYVNIFQLHYNFKRNGENVFYYRVLSHIFGTLVVLGTIITTVCIVAILLKANDAAKHHKHVNAKDQRRVVWMKYATGLLCIFFTGVNTSLQCYNAYREIHLVHKRSGSDAAVRILKSVDNMPPRGRADFYEINVESEPYHLPV